MLYTQSEFKDKIHKRLRIRLMIYFVLAVVILGISIFHIIRDQASFIFCIIGFMAGLGIGILATRMFKISWDTNATQVISRFDAIGIVILILYILFEINREKIVEHFISGPSVIAVSFAVLSGLMCGRVLGIRGKISSIFREQGIR